MGKVAAVGRGVRKTTSKLAGHLEPGTVVDVSFVEGRGSLYTITAAQGIRPMVHVSSAIDLLPVFTHILEVTEALTHEEEPDTRLYDLLSSTLQQLDLIVQTEQPKSAALRASFDLAYLRLLGLQPELRACVSCRAELFPVENRMSFHLGGVLCPSCGDDDHESVPLSVDVLKLLRHFSRSDGGADANVYMPAKVQASLFFILDRLFAYLMSRETSSSRLKKAVDRLSEKNANAAAAALESKRTEESQG